MEGTITYSRLVSGRASVWHLIFLTLIPMLFPPPFLWQIDFWLHTNLSGLRVGPGLLSLKLGEADTKCGLEQCTQRDQNHVVAGGYVPSAAMQFAWEARGGQSQSRKDGQPWSWDILDLWQLHYKTCLSGRTETFCQLITAPSSLPQFYVDIHSLLNKFLVHSCLGYSSLDIFSPWA